MTTAHIDNFKGSMKLSRFRTKRRAEPSDPAEIARRAYEAKVRAGGVVAAERERLADAKQWGINQEIAELATSDDIDHGADIVGKITRAKRWDVFTLLHHTRIGDPRDKLTVLSDDNIGAVNRFQKDLAIRHQTAGVLGSGRSGDVPSDYPLARIEAAERLFGRPARPDQTLGVVTAMIQNEPAQGLRFAKLLFDLSTPTVTRGERVNWRKAVQMVTGEHRDALQAQEVRKACDALVAAYLDCDRVGRARAA